MCLIINRPTEGKRGSGRNVPNAIIDHNLKSNPHGFGLAWRVGDELAHIKYGPEHAQDFRAKLKEVDRMRTEYTAHFRFATHGKPCHELSHPYKYHDGEQDVLLFHNGMIDIDTDEGESDTLAFMNKVLAKLGPSWWKNDALRFLVKKSIGWSRLLMMTTDETIRLYDDWKKIDGIWYSTNPLPSYAKTPSRPRADDLLWMQAQQAKMVDIASYDEYEVGDDDEESQLLLAAGDIDADDVDWTDFGHPVKPLDAIQTIFEDRNGDAICETCQTSGEYWLVDGTVWFDIPHPLAGIGAMG